MEAGEAVNVSLHKEGDPECPFCPGKKEDAWKTFKGKDNDSGTLRDAMNKPSRCGFAQQTGARPKDGKEERQAVDVEKISPNPIFNHSVYGDYGNQAHHAISGNEIMKGHSIEKIIKNEDGTYDGDTGYTINNCANGVYLPSAPSAGYKGSWRSQTDEFKLEAMKPAMNKCGQAHIGGHEGHSLPGGDTYPSAIKKKLDEIVLRVVQKSKECPFCVTGDGNPKKPFIPPYKVNQWLDNLSNKTAGHLKSTDPLKWNYFISGLAKAYHLEEKLSVPKSKKQKLL